MSAPSANTSRDPARWVSSSRSCAPAKWSVCSPTIPPARIAATEARTLAGAAVQLRRLSAMLNDGPAIGLLVSAIGAIEAHGDAA